MAAIPYRGFYGRFFASENTQAATLMGADTLVGDELAYHVVHEKERTVVRLENRFGGAMGELDAQTAGVVQLCEAKEWHVHLLLASLYQKQDESHALWGEVVVLAYPQVRAKVFDVFRRRVAQLLGDGVRPEVDLAQGALEQLVAAGGNWVPQGRRAALAEKDSVLVKKQLSLNEKLVEQARKRNPGCMAAGWLFIALLVFLGVYLVGRLLGF